MSGQPTVIYSAANTQQAYLLKGLLEDQGIRAWVVNDAIQLAGGDLPLGWAAAARVVVAEQDALAAREIAEQFDQQTAHEETTDEMREPTALGDWPDWPTCPGCGERRSARCPVCGASGTTFPIADLPEVEGEQRVLLVCKDCDDHMLPQWYRLCPRCGHDFGSGVEAESPARPVIDISRGEWLVAVALVLGGIVLAAYFIWLFSRRAG